MQTFDYEKNLKEKVLPEKLVYTNIHGKNINLGIIHYLDVFHRTLANNVRFVLPYFAEKFLHNECVICYEEFVESTLVHKLACNHSFHLECLRLWLHQKSHCPYCRREIKFKWKTIINYVTTTRILDLKLNDLHIYLSTGHMFY
ncbi:hypothetical protein HELRODRAFT_80515 [Helobdella robusta]|uniref:RING-type domain-containing protein n=1 Tax=Helobdella robusta TaxID=6412 RepID=T1G416_HELRO|nr:hypothetical protein HELRODRAFT_80515 [Helobdella robusta]ESO03444.1 hypothetical protein HELRODRAFT_80515 [Helobdella robusta]